MLIAPTSKYHFYLEWAGVNTRLAKCLNSALNVNVESGSSCFQGAFSVIMNVCVDLRLKL